MVGLGQAPLGGGEEAPPSPTPPTVLLQPHPWVCPQPHTWPRPRLSAASHLLGAQLPTPTAAWPQLCSQPTQQWAWQLSPTVDWLQFHSRPQPQPLGETRTGVQGWGRAGNAQP